ncbi:MAG: glutamate-5-semialdehyde dehydrogenase [Planctomycetota bacterium]
MIDVPTALAEEILELGVRARAAARRVAALSPADRARILRAMADGIDEAAATIQTANARDLAAGRAAGLSVAMLDRLTLDPARIAEIARGLRQVADLPDPLNEVLRTIRPENGLVIRKVRVPLGVIGMIYESRPNVTADAAALCFKAGNAVILRGGSEARESNAAIHDAMNDSGLGAGLPEHAIQLITTTDRAAVTALLQLESHVDLIVPRGGEGLIRAVSAQSRVPVLRHYKGVCHVYVDAAADLDMAGRIAVNAKCQRPGVCNAMETLLVHEAIADAFLPDLGRALGERSVEIRGDERTRGLIPGAVAATDDDWAAEYLDLVLAVRVVPDLDAAIDHIERWGSHHSDVIVTADDAAATRFLREVDSATVYHNASSRFTDGAQFGMGAEIGISTDKLHARGPCGVEELTTYKYVIEGSGQIRA